MSGMRFLKIDIFKKGNLSYLFAFSPCLFVFSPFRSSKGKQTAIFEKQYNGQIFTCSIESPCEFGYLTSNRKIRTVQIHSKDHQPLIFRANLVFSLFERDFLFIKNRCFLIT